MATRENTEQSTKPKRKLPPALEANLWKPGQTGNPGGRPKKKPITEMFEQMLESEEDFEAIKSAMRSIFFQKSGIAKVMLAKDMADRIEGKVSQPIEANVTVNLADAIAAARKRAGK